MDRPEKRVRLLMADGRLAPDTAEELLPARKPAANGEGSQR